MKNSHSQPYIYMAPLRGITDALFRRVYYNHFDGIDAAVAPFINPQRKAGLTDRILADVLPRESIIPLIPQLLNTDGDDFLALAERLFELGYGEINWNLGCPVPMVAKKKRGAGLLPYPEQICAVLDFVVPRLKSRLSLKIRLGYDDFQESINLLPLLDDYPLSEIIIHARLGKQLYRGSTYPEKFSLCQQATRHRLVYNGDITSLSDYTELKSLVGINRWMIGRGLIANPFLPAEIKGQQISARQRLAKLRSFHDELYAEMKERLEGPGHLLGRMKQVWIYFIGSFPNSRKSLKPITKARTEQHYLMAVEELFSSHPGYSSQSSNSSFMTGSASSS